MHKITITSDDVDRTESSDVGISKKRQSMPLWWRWLSGIFIFVPPVLFLIIIIGLIINRQKNLSAKYSYTLHYCCLLIISGIVWIFLWTIFINGFSGKTHEPFIKKTSITINTTPKFSSTGPFSAKDIASSFSPMVVEIHSDEMEGKINNDRTFGAGVIVNIFKDGCLILTSRHVIDAVSNYQNENQIVVISLQDGQQAIAKIVGMHNKLDLSLLWIRKTIDNLKFLQPIRNYNTIKAGESVYVIGHPEGLAYSISNGLVSQKRNEELIQISAPVSPGNSGGPVYDENGNLIGIIQSVLDKTKKPNAENLNFAVRADVLKNSDSWSLTEKGVEAISVFSSRENENNY